MNLDDYLKNVGELADAAQAVRDQFRRLYGQLLRADYTEDNASLSARLTGHVVGWLLGMGWDGTVPDSWKPSA